MLEPLKLGNRVEMVFRSESKSDEDTIEYASQILDFTEDDCIICAMPIQEGHVVPLQRGQRFEGYFYSENKIYKALCSIKSRGKEGNIYIIEISLESTLVRIQRREYFRMNCLMYATLQIVSDIKDGQEAFINKAADVNKEKCTIVDISGGGIRAFTKEHYEKGMLVAIQLILEFNNGKKEKNIVGKVIDSFKNSNDASMYDNRIQFVDIKEADRDEIIKYIFERQRNILKKELDYNG